jgi:cytidylate kinase
MTYPSTIAIDGPAGSGKSSVCSALAAELHYLFVDTGAFYRALTLAAINADLITADEAAIAHLADRSHFDISKDHYDDDVYTIWLDGEDVTNAVRTPQVETYVSEVARMPAVRDALNLKYRQLAMRGNVIMAGRDIGTVVLPNAELKLYLDASAEVRAQRRVVQRESAGLPADYPTILNTMRERDRIDSTRMVAPLQRADDAIYVNSDNMSIEQVVRMLKEIIVAWKPANERVE